MVHRLKYKQVDMFCPMCVLNVAKALCRIDGIIKLDVNLKTRTVALSHNNKSLSRQDILSIINESINSGRIRRGAVKRGDINELSCWNQ